METIIYNLSGLFPYFVSFPIIVIFIFLFLKVFSKIIVKKNNIVMYGLLVNMGIKEISSYALVFLQFIVVIQTLFVSKFTIYNAVILFTPGVLYGIINLSLIEMIINIIATSFLGVVCIFEKIFYSYLVDVDMIWYVIVIFVILCLFVFVFDFYILIRNICQIMNRKMKREKISF